MIIRRTVSNLRQWLVATCAMLLMCLQVPGHAAFITTNETGLDTIFSQASFGSDPIDIRFNLPVYISAPSLLSLDSQSEWDALLGLAPRDAPTVNVFFIDTVRWCSTLGSWVGCGQLAPKVPDAHIFAVDSLTAASANGAELLAHELGHNLGLLDLAEGAADLMNCCGFGDTTISAAEVATIRTSSLVRADILGKYYMYLTPVLIIPEPGTLALILLPLLFCLRRRERKQLSCPRTAFVRDTAMCRPEFSRG